MLQRTVFKKVRLRELPGVTVFVREVDGVAVGLWCRGLAAAKELSAGTAVRHFNVMYDTMEKANAIWSKETRIDRNPLDAV
jgi:hypothetical protein